MPITGKAKKKYNRIRYLNKKLEKFKGKYNLWNKIKRKMAKIICALNY